MDTPAPIRVMVSSRDVVTVAGIGAIVAADPDLRIVAEARSGADGVAVAQRVRPDVIVAASLDHSAMAVLGLLTAIAPVVALLSVPDAGSVVTSVRAGARAVVQMADEHPHLICAIQSCAHGLAYLSPSLTVLLTDHLAGKGNRQQTWDLTPRESQVLVKLADGMSNAEIAERMGLDERTVKYHVSNLLGKLGVRDRVRAVVLAYKHGVVV